jgi:adenosylcobinamide kinase/adenosylcobinamide-phosphate guanylyltransferase
MAKRILITGPTQSGKSEWAEHLAHQATERVIYVATAQRNASDAEWQARIEHHQQRRPPHWHTLEEPFNLAQVLSQAHPDECWLVDSLGTWLANCLEQSPAQWDITSQAVLNVIATCPGTLILVAEETGWGIVPAYPLGRTFRDRLGRLTRQVGEIADVAYLVVAGFAIDLKTLGTTVPHPSDVPPA